MRKQQLGEYAAKAKTLQVDDSGKITNRPSGRIGPGLIQDIFNSEIDKPFDEKTKCFGPSNSGTSNFSI